MTTFGFFGSAIANLLMIVLYLVLLWIFGRMGDNINKIRKMIEEEIRYRNTTSASPR